MSRNFVLTFAHAKGVFSFPISLEKSYTGRPSLKTGYKSGDAYQLVRYIKVVPKNPDKKIMNVKDIGHICSSDELVHLHPSEDDKEEYLPIDKSSLKNLFPSDPEMRVLYSLKKNFVPFNYIGDKHYFVHLNGHKNGKKKSIDSDDQVLHDVICNGLEKNDEVLIVTYVMSNTQNFGIIYSDGEGLRMSSLIASNFQKERSDTKSDVKIVKKQQKIYEKLVGETRKKSLNKKKIIDDYAKKLEELIQDTISGKPQTKKKVIKRTYSKLDALDSDNEEEEDEEEDEEDEEEEED